MFRTIFTTLTALLKLGLCATQFCIRSDTASYKVCNSDYDGGGGEDADDNDDDDYERKCIDWSN